jgi:carbon monoxide dehydrogenase subunit G
MYKVGPVPLTWAGTARLTERDPGARTVVVAASGEQISGGGTASVTIRASLEPEGSGGVTKVILHTTLNIARPSRPRRPGQVDSGGWSGFGDKLVKQFATNLTLSLTSPMVGKIGTGTGRSGPVAAAQTERETRRQAPERSWPRIFLCYRRDDTEGFARGIYERLASKYGNEQVFRDIDSTPAGVKFSAWIESRVGECSVMIVLIGPSWSSAKDDTGQRRLDLPKDGCGMKLRRL